MGWEPRGTCCTMITSRCAAYAQGRPLGDPGQPYPAIVIKHIRLDDALLPQLRARCKSEMTTTRYLTTRIVASGRSVTALGRAHL